MKLIDTHQLLFYNDYLHVLSASIHTVKENTEASVFVSNEIGLELNDENTMCMVMSQEQHAVQNQNIYVGNESFETFEHFSYLETSLTNQNYFHEEMRRSVPEVPNPHFFKNGALCSKRVTGYSTTLCHSCLIHIQCLYDPATSWLMC